MAGAEERAIRKLERQIARTQQRLEKVQGRKRRRGGLLGGVVLGTVAGGLLTYYLIQRNSDDEWEQESADDAILLREQPMPTGQTAEVKPLPKLDVAASTGNPTDEVAATTLETPRPASLAQPVKAQMEQPPQDTAATPTEQPAAQAEPPKREQPAKTEALAMPQQAQAQGAPLPVETERPEIVSAESSGNTDEELAEASSNEPTPAPSEMRAEPVDGTCPASHPIKGNRGSMGAMIYHVPGGRNYERTKPEACFATTEAAEEAGYRAPRG
jgi:hypothetical protein